MAEENNKLCVNSQIIFNNLVDLITRSYDGTNNNTAGKQNSIQKRDDRDDLSRILNNAISTTGINELKNFSAKQVLKCFRLCSIHPTQNCFHFDFSQIGGNNGSTCEDYNKPKVSEFDFGVVNELENKNKRARDDSPDSLTSSDSEFSDGMAKTTKRFMEKSSYCLICNVYVPKFYRHLMKKHSTLQRVKKIAKYPLGSIGRYRELNKLSDEWFDKKSTDRSYNDNLIKCTKNELCSNCENLFTKYDIMAHYEKCIVKYNKFKAGFIYKPCQQLIDLYCQMSQDDITEIIKKEPLIINYGNHLCQNCGENFQKDLIISKLRLIGKFLIEAQKIDSNIINLQNIFNANFDIVIKVAKICAEYNEEEKELDKPNVVMDLKYCLSFIAQDYLDYKLDMKDKNRYYVDDFLDSLNNIRCYYIEYWYLRQVQRAQSVYKENKSRVTTRRRWSTQEKDIINKYMKKHIENDTLPSFEECKRLIYNNLIFKNRSPPVIKAYVNNLINKKE